MPTAPISPAFQAPSFLDRLLGRRHEPVVTEAAPLVRPGSMPVTETIEEFVHRASKVDAIRSIVARSHGESVDFLVTGEGPWHAIIDELEPRLVDLIVERGAAFEYSVVRPGMEAQPEGYLSVFERG